MDSTNPKYFDYLDEYGVKLQEHLYPDLLKDIELARESGYKDPRGAINKCRYCSEAVLNSYLGKNSMRYRKLNIYDKIETAKKQKLISDAYAKKFHEIRDWGGGGSHPNKKSRKIGPKNAEDCLKLLDEILRKYTAEYIDPAVVYSIKVDEETDSVLFFRSDNKIEDIEKNSKMAAALEGRPSIEQEGKKTAKKAKEQNEAIGKFSNRMAKLYQEADQMEIDFGLNDEVEQFRSSLDEDHEKMASEVKKVDFEVAEVEKKIEKILSEHDFIEKLLKGNDKATDDQMNVMAFPRDSKSSATILQIAGSAGTGKTLCLLAKIIKEIESYNDTNGQLNLDVRKPKKGLFICFNTSLRDYVKSLLENYPRAKEYIDLFNFDSLIYQLTMPGIKSKLKDYANDVRYPLGYELHYENDNGPNSLMGKAMQKTIEVYPEQAREYYLDNTNKDNVSWMNDEIKWLEARYTDPDEAKKPYLVVSRIGRGTKRRPNKDVRKVILKVWSEYRALLEKNHFYTIEQAVKRLMDSKSLPKYGYIAIDEVQDFTVSSIKFLLQLRVSDKSRVYIAGDEDQKLYPRDFTWKELNQDLAGYTIRLYKNMRNTSSISKFADRMRDVVSPLEESSEGICISQASKKDVLECARSLISNTDETTALIGVPQYWCPCVEEARLPLENPMDNKGRNKQREVDITHPGLYVFSELKCKGLEFDNIIITNIHSSDKRDIDEEKRRWYVQFTRARKRLYIFYDHEPPKLLQEYYSDFLSA